MLMGGDGEKDDAGGEGSLRKREDDLQEKVADDGDRENNDDYQRHDSSRSTERWGSSRRCRDARAEEEYSERNPPPMPSYGNEKESNSQSVAVVVKTRQQILQEREVKIREARERYFKRRGVVAQ